MIRAWLVTFVAVGLIAAAPIQLSQPAQSHGPPIGQPQSGAASNQTKSREETNGTETNPFVVEQKDTTQQKEEANKHATYEAEEARNDWLIAIFTVVLGVVGIVELFILALQIHWMRRTVVDSNKQHQMNNRAFVSVEFEYELALIDDSKSGRATVLETVKDRSLFVTRFAVQPIWKNTGNTPTRNMRIRIDWAGINNILEPGTYRRDEIAFFVPPKSSSMGEIIEMPGLNSLIQDGRGIQEPPALLIWGRADYEDIFGNSYFTEWCYRARPSRPVEDERLTVGFVQWPEYNRAN